MGFRRRHLKSVTLNNSERISMAAYEHGLDFVRQHHLQLTWRIATQSLELASDYIFEHILLREGSGWCRETRSKREGTLYGPPICPAPHSTSLGFGLILSWLICNLEWTFQPPVAHSYR